MRTYAEEISALQSDLSNLVAWSTEWQMLFNIDTCKVMHMGYNNMQAEYAMNDVKLERKKFGSYRPTTPLSVTAYIRT